VHKCMCICICNKLHKCMRRETCAATCIYVAAACRNVDPFSPLRHSELASTFQAKTDWVLAKNIEFFSLLPFDPLDSFQYLRISHSQNIEPNRAITFMGVMGLINSRFDYNSDSELILVYFGAELHFCCRAQCVRGWSS
jgi:hypothetical protein